MQARAHAIMCATHVCLAMTLAHIHQPGAVLRQHKEPSVLAAWGATAFMAHARRRSMTVPLTPTHQHTATHLTRPQRAARRSLICTHVRGVVATKLVCAATHELAAHTMPLPPQREHVMPITHNHRNRKAPARPAARM